ncbi:MAG: VOC family protein [Cytophagales bacterium]|nr:VOC family protein [Bernardetiaceae bacterium]MDW8209642.1 VOC family protein [Cytophagales bacterium]
MEIIGIDHISLHVADLIRSKFFYQEIIGLKEITRPAFDFPGAWFSLNNSQTLHLIEGRQHMPHWGGRSTHIALAVEDITLAANYFRTKGIITTDIKKRPDGIRQFFVTDPDGYCIEFCEKMK